MDSRPSRKETIAYSIAFILALGMRFLLLGKLPLTDSEASLALQALQISQGAKPALASNVAYINFSAILFFIFGSTNFLARFIPALVGSALALAPALFREKLKIRPAVILAFFFAIDPALVALSRQAGSSILALTFTIFAAGFLLRRRSTLAGIFAAFALLSGPALWTGLLGILLAWMLSQFMSARKDTGTQVHTYTGTHVHTEDESDTSTPGTSHLTPETSHLTPETSHLTPETSHLTPETSHLTPDTSTPDTSTLITDYRSLITALLATLLLTSSLFLLTPQGLGAWLASLPAYLSGWTTPSLVPVSRLFLALGVYQLLGIVFALIAIARSWWTGDRQLLLLGIWAVAAFLLAVAYPARQPADLVWMLIPLWTLAALELSRHLHILPEDRLETAGVIAFTIILLAFAWVDLTQMYYTPFPSAQANARLSLFFGAILLVLLSLILVGFGWSAAIARSGAAWGAGIMLGLYTLGAAWGASGLRNPNAAEVWDASPRLAQADLLAQTADDISEWATGDAHALPVLIQGIDSPALVWALRFHNPQQAAALDVTSSPALVITPLQQTLQLSASYRGQDFSWRQFHAWDARPFNTIRWLTLRELPSTSETIILWARDNLFVDTRP
ncbi:MAG: hypothetical protein HFACDABA_00953 [Anaerolineales bacterium]|nr:hypothetical protein [Anaerolineales bacterium]